MEKEIGKDFLEIDQQQMSTLGAFKTVCFTSSHLICTGGLYIGTYVVFLHVPRQSDPLQLLLTQKQHFCPWNMLNGLGLRDLSTFFGFFSLVKVSDMYCVIYIV